MSRKKNIPAAQSRRARILLVEDHSVVRYGFAQLINRQSDLVVCGEAESARAAMEEIQRVKPDMVVVDISLKDSSGLDLIRKIKNSHPKLPVLVVSALDEAICAEVAFRAGALGYIMKDRAVEDLLAGIRRVLEGAVYVSDALAAKMLKAQVQRGADIGTSPAERLSDREVEVLNMLGHWKGTTQIAKELGVSASTVDYFREQLKKKLNLKNSVELIRYATSWVDGEGVSLIEPGELKEEN